MAIQNIITERVINNTSTDEATTPRNPQITNVSDSRDIDNTSSDEATFKASQSVSDATNTNDTETLSDLEVFTFAVRIAAINSSQRIVEEGVKERGYITKGNPQQGSFVIGLKPTPEESVNDITNEARLFAYDVINDNAVRNACIWGTMSVDDGDAYQDEQYAYRTVVIS